MERQGPRVLVVDDEKSIQEALGLLLPPAGFTVFSARDGNEALRIFQLARPDLILLDLGLPDVDGKEIIQRIRETAPTPIIVISVRYEESEIVRSLNNGANDYLRKPFTAEELLARMRAALRSISATKRAIFTVDDLRVNLGRREVFVGRSQVKLTATEYDLLKALVEHAGAVRTHRELIRELWGGAQYEDPAHLLRVTVSNLRRKLHLDPLRPRYIVTEPGVGYRLRAENSGYARGARQRS